jgi:ribosomal protein S18 acetylase RimI-like enzyme
MAEYRTRPVAPGDADVICRHRDQLFLEAGQPEAVVRRASEPFRAWLLPHLADGSYSGWVVEFGGKVVAGLGLMYIDWPPHPLHPDHDRRGYITNVYVDPEHRGRKLTSQLMNLAEDACRSQGLPYMVLHATPAGRPVYEGRGWQQTTEMGLKLGPA